MTRKTEKPLLRVARHLPPGIDLTWRTDPNHWIWRGMVRHGRKLQPQSRFGHPVRIILREWFGDITNILAYPNCPEPLCINPFHYLLRGKRAHPWEEHPRTPPYHQTMEGDQAEIREAIEVIQGWETMSLDELSNCLHGICTREEIQQCLPSLNA